MLLRFGTCNRSIASLGVSPQSFLLIWINSASRMLPVAVLLRLGLTGISEPMEERAGAGVSAVSRLTCREMTCEVSCAPACAATCWGGADCTGCRVGVADGAGCEPVCAGACGLLASSGCWLRPAPRFSICRYICSMPASASRINCSRCSGLAPTGTGISISMVCARPPLVNCVL